jgi:membrane-associated PAP2 superfamily phosphatase
MQFQKNQAKAQTSAFWLRSGVWTLAFALFMMLIYPTFDLDFHLSNLFFDAQQQRFTLRGHPILNVWLHTGIKWVMVCVALVSLALAISAHWLVKLKPYQSALFWVFIGMVLSTSAVAILKYDSMHACPWDLTIYGGDSPFFDLFKNPPAGTKSGGCFPAGHPSGGFALIAFYFAFRRYRARFAGAMLWLGILMGLAMGLVQIIRGAHFLSHVLWSGWVVWLTLLLLYGLWTPKIKSRHKA